MCESRGGRPGPPVHNSPYGLCGRKAIIIELDRTRVRESWLPLERTEDAECVLASFNMEARLLSV